jgi:hypothetical protein
MFTNKNDFKISKLIAIKSKSIYLHYQYYLNYDAIVMIHNNKR